MRERPAQVTERCSAAPEMQGRHCTVSYYINDTVRHQADRSERDARAVRFGLLEVRGRFQCMDLPEARLASAWYLYGNRYEQCDVVAGPAAGMHLLLISSYGEIGGCFGEHTGDVMTLWLYTDEYVAHDGVFRKLLALR